MKNQALKIGILLLCVAVGALIFTLPTTPKEAVSKDSDLDKKVKEAVALVQFGQQPMAGIQLLREVIAKDSLHPEALYQLGVFSIQSRQWDKGLERFETLKREKGFSKYPDAYYYHALCYASLDSLPKALTLINEGLTVVEDSSLNASLTQFRNTIINLKN